MTAVHLRRGSRTALRSVRSRARPSMSWARLRAAAALLSALILLALPTGAGAATPRTSLTDVENEVMCLVCGTPLNVAQSPQADRERAYIRRLIERGDTKQQVKDELVAGYGPNVLALPKPSGFNLTVYVIPIAAVLAALVALALILPRWRRRRAAAAAVAATPTGNGAGPGLSSAEARRLDEDLARYDA